MDKIKSENSSARDKKGEAGSGYIETVISILILTVGLLATVSAISYALLYAQESERKTRAKEIAGSMLENIFAIRDIQSQDGLAIKGWDAVQIKKPDNSGIFIRGWFPAREGPGVDGIYGTADDSCGETANCTLASVITGYERDINVTDINENGVVRKRRIDVSVRYKGIGNTYHQENISTIVANFPTDTY